MEPVKKAAPPTGNGRNSNQALLQQRLPEVLSEWYGPRVTVLSRVPLRLGGKVLLPDVAVYEGDSRPQLADSAEVTDTPLLAVVVLDPAAPYGPQVAAARQLVAAGVPSCWLVEPVLRTVTVSGEPGSYQSFNLHETLRDPATGIELELVRLFG